MEVTICPSNTTDICCSDIVNVNTEGASSALTVAVIDQLAPKDMKILSCIGKASLSILTFMSLH